MQTTTAPHDVATTTLYLLFFERVCTINGYAADWQCQFLYQTPAFTSFIFHHCINNPKPVSQWHAQDPAAKHNKAQNQRFII